MLKTDLHSGWALNVESPRSAQAAALPPSISATVPGTVHTDLLSAGLIADPYIGLNEIETSWIGYETWTYKTEFARPDGDFERHELAFDGLDTVATVKLNGVELGNTANQHRTYRFSVTELLEDANTLEVTFHSAWDYAEELRDGLGNLPNAYPTPFNFIRKMAANFGWDWGPQLVTAGIWKDVRLESWSGARLREVIPTISLDGSDGVVRLTVAGEQTTQSESLTLEVQIAGIVNSVRFAGNSTIAVRVPDAQKWWPHDLGDQPLYDVSVRIRRGDETLDSWKRRIGFRTVELDTTADAEGTPFRFLINGVPVFVRGANWIPDDCFPSRLTAERYRDRIEQAIGANLNLLRVWGGGIFERDEFYDTADELGVLTWQDFLFACAAYPEEEPIRSEVINEVRDNVLRLSSHPSLILWNGCNENIWGWFDWGWQESTADRTWGMGYYTEIIPDLLNEIDSNRPYWPGSPYSGDPFTHPNAEDHGNVHFWEVWNRIDYTAYAGYRPRFVSEFGFQGPPTWSTFAEAFGDNVESEDDPVVLLHQKAEDGNGKLARGLAPHLPAPQNLQEWHQLTQLNQARAIDFGVSRFRAQKPRCMGTIVWQLNDCWPVTSWAAVDGYGRRKPLWHALRRANAPQLAVILPGEDKTELVLVNDTRSDWRAVGQVARLKFDGSVLAELKVDVTVPALGIQRIQLPTDLAHADEPTSELLFAAVSEAANAVHLFAEDKDAQLSAPSVTVEASDWRDGSQLLTFRSSELVRGLVLEVDRLEPDAWVSDSDLTIVPGRDVTVTIHSPRPFEIEELSDAEIMRSVNGVTNAESNADLLQ